MVYFPDSFKTKSSINEEDVVFSLKGMKESEYEFKELRPKELYALIDKTAHAINIAFFEFSYQCEDDIAVSLLWYTEGIAGLKECRHSYVGDGGYLHYANGDNIIAVINELKSHFNM